MINHPNQLFNKRRHSEGRVLIILLCQLLYDGKFRSCQLLVSKSYALLGALVLGVDVLFTYGVSTLDANKALGAPQTYPYLRI